MDKTGKSELVEDKDTYKLFPYAYVAMTSNPIKTTKFYYDGYGAYNSVYQTDYQRVVSSHKPICKIIDFDKDESV